MKKIIVIILLCVALAVLFFTAFRLLKGRVGQGEAESISAVQNTPSSEFSHEKPVYFVGETRLKQNGEAFFSADLSDFIFSVNSVYMQESSEPLLSPKEDWVHFADSTPYSGVLSLCYRFSPNPENISEPTISVFVPEDKKGFYEIKLTYDEHGNQRHLYDKYKKMCLWVLEALLPDLSASEREELYDKLNLQSMENFRGGEEFYSGTQPFPQALITLGNMGFYGYYGGGTANICCVARLENE